jgi:hypothetical protein
MANVSLEVGTQLSFADHAGDFSPDVSRSLEIGVPTDVQMSVAGRADNTAQQSDKFDLGINRAPRYSVMSSMEFFANPTSGERLDYYVGWSPVSTGALGNPTGVSGSDAQFTGAPLTLDESLGQLDYVGAMILGAYTGVQTSHIGTIVPKERYGTLVVVNRSGTTLANTDDIECHTVFTPIVDDVAATD